MALTTAQVREILSTAGVSAENVDDAVRKIMDGHVTSINALREERDSYKADAEKLRSVQKELDEIKANGDQDWQQKYENEHKDFEDYKVQIENEKIMAEKVNLYRSILKECNVEESRIDSVIKVSGEAIANLVINDGKLDDAETVKKHIQDEWAGFIVKKESKGAKVDTPPAGSGSNDFESMSLADKMQYANEHPNDESVQEWLKN